MKCSLMWLSGTTGFGKSVLASYLSEALAQKFPDAPMAYFFCKDNTFLHDAHQIVRTLLHQFTGRFKSLRRQLKQIWENESEIAELTATVEDFFNLLLVPAFETLSTSSGKLFIILDGLNECSEPNLEDILELLHLLQHIPISKATPHLHILVTCQPKREIATALNRSNKVVLFENHNRESINAYLKAKLDDTLAARFKGAGTDPFEFFAKRHNGMFLWVTMLLKYLERMDSTEDFRSILEEVPDSLSGLYREVLSKLNNDLVERERLWIKEIITWTVMAKRDLKLSELELAIVQSRTVWEKKTGGEYSMFRIESTLSKCGAILQVIAVDAATPLEEKTVGLVHDTFKQFVIDANKCNPCFFIDTNYASALLAMTTISYLLDQIFDFPSDETATPETIDQEHPLFSYASLFWSKHLREAETVDSHLKAELKSFLQMFLGHSQLSKWFCMVVTYIERSMSWPSDPHLKSVPDAFYNIVDWIALQNLQLLGTGTSVEIVDGLGLENTSTRNNIAAQWGSQVAAHLWLTGDPQNYRASMARFMIVRALDLQAKEDIEMRADTPISDTVGRLSSMIESQVPEKGVWWFMNLGHAYRNDFPNVDALRLAASQYRAALASSRGSDEVADIDEVAGILYTISDTLSRSFWQTASLRDINESIAYGQNAMDMYSATGTIREWSVCAGSVACALQQRADTFASEADLDLSILLLRKLVTLPHEHNPLLELCQSRLCTALKIRFQWKSDIKDIDEAIDWGRKSISAPISDSDLPLILSSLALALVERFEYLNTSTESAKLQLDRNHEDAEEIVEYAEKALALVPEGHPDLPSFQSSLALALWRKGTYTASIHDMRSAIQYQTAAMDNTAADNINLARYLYNQGRMQLEAFLMQTSHSLELPLINESITCCQRAVNITPPTHPKWKGYVDGLVASLHTRYESTGNMADLDAVVLCLKNALKGSESMGTYQHRLCVLLRMRHEALGSVEDLSESISNGKASVEIHGTPDSYYMLGLAQFQKFELNGTLDGLDESITNITKAITLSELEKVETHTKYHTLSSALLSKASKTNSLEDLDKSIECAKKALQDCELSGLPINKPFCASHLGWTLHARFLATRSVKNLAAAMEYAQKAVDATPEDHAHFDMYRRVLNRIMLSFQSLQTSNSTQQFERE
jgi:tetratricopeptide (TPR) repeat protein